MLIHFGQSSYFKANHGVDRYFLETYLLPGLEEQGVIASGSRGIELPVGENQEPEYITLPEAKALVLDWLEQSNNLLETDKKKLERIRSYEQFATLASNIYQAKVKDPNKLATAARLQNIADLREKNKIGASTATPHYDPGKVIDDYNKLYLKLLSSSRVGIPHNLLQQLVSGGIPSGAGDMSERALASVISAHLPRLYSAGSVGSSEEARNYAVVNELSNIIRSSYPEMTGLLNVLGDPNTAANLREITTRLARDFESTSTLESYEKIQAQAVSASDNYLLNQKELGTQIYNSFPEMSAADRNSLTSAILSEMVSSSTRPLTTGEILNRVSQKLNIPDAQFRAIQTSLAESGVSVSLEYRQNEIAMMVGNRHLTGGERNLLSKGINPFLTHASQEKLISLESKLLSEYNAISGHDKRYTSLQEAYLNEQQSPNPNFSFLERSRAHFDQRGAYDNLSLSDRALVRRTRFGRWVTDVRSRAYETQAKFFDKWIDIEETITGKKLFNKLYDQWDTFAEGFTIPGTKIPFFRIVPWLSDRWDEWKKINTLKVLARTSQSTSWVGKTIHWTAKHYELGGFTTNGAIYHFTTEQWGKVVKWSLARTGMTGVVKYAGISATRTATRLLLKIGGRTLARFGAKAVGAVLTAATAIGSVVFAIGMIIDFISMGLEFIKEFFRNSQFRKTIMGWGAAITAFVASINIGAIFVGIGAALSSVLPIMFAEGLAILLIALAIVGVTIFTVPQIQNEIKNTFNLDSGISSLVASVICDQSTLANPSATANVALCIAELAYKCPGVNPMTESAVGSQSWQCFVGGLVFKKAVTELEISSHISNGATGPGNVQCVGLSVASAADGDGSFSTGQRHACSYATINKPSGYTYLPGCPGVQSGDHFIMGVEKCVSTGGTTVGHIGVVIEADGGVGFSCVDANYSFAGNGIQPGEIRGPDKCHFAISEISGCLRKI